MMARARSSLVPITPVGMFEVRGRRPFPQELGIRYDRKLRIRIFVLDDPLDLITGAGVHGRFRHHHRSRLDIGVRAIASGRDGPSQTVLVRLLANRASVHVDFETDGQFDDLRGLPGHFTFSSCRLGIDSLCR